MESYGAATSVGTCGLDRDHTFEVRVDGDEYYVYVDNVRYPTSGTLLISDKLTTDATGNEAGIRGNSDDGIIKEFHYDELDTDRTRVYFSSTGNDSTGDGSIATPYQSISKIESEIAANGEGYTYCLKSGDTWDDSSGAGFCKWDSVSNVSVEAYGLTGAKPIIDHWVELSGFSVFSGNIYQLASSGDDRAFLMEDGVRLDGSAVNNRINSTVAGFEQPAAGSLAAGEWRCEADNSTVYLHCSDSANPSTHTILMATSSPSKAVFDAGNSTNVVISDISVTGASSGQGQLALRSDCVDCRIQYCDCAHGYQGQTYGGNDATTAGGRGTWIWQCTSTAMQWRGLGAISPAAPEALAPVIAGNLSHENFKVKYMRGDQEPIMITQGDGGTGDAADRFLVALNVTHDNGDTYAPTDYAAGMESSGGYHPGGINIDSANGDVCYNIISKGYLNANIWNMLSQDIDHAYFYNNIILGFDAANIDEGTHGRVAGVFLRLRSGYDISGFLCAWNTFVDSAFTDVSSETNGGVVAYMDSSSTCAGSVLYNVWSGYDGAWFYNLNRDGSNTLDLTIDGNAYEVTDTTGATTRAKYLGSNISWTTLSAGTWGDSYDTASTYTDPDLAADFTPNVGSPAIGIGNDDLGLEKLDAYLNPRTQDTAGAVEAD